jgi:cytoskeletal protein CcmA (bactofilin family)
MAAKTLLWGVEIILPISGSDKEPPHCRELRDNVLTIGPNGRIKAQIFAKTVIVLGTVNGSITASDRVDIRDAGSVDGNIVSPRVAIADGAHLRGSVDMQKKGPHLVKSAEKGSPAPAGVAH